MFGKLAFGSGVIAGWLVLPLGALAQTVKVEDVAASAPTPTRQEQPDLEQVAKLVLEKTNKFRQSLGLQPVGTSPQLTSAARYFAPVLAKTGKLSHTADDKQPGERAEKHGYEYCLVSENIAYDESSTVAMCLVRDSRELRPGKLENTGVEEGGEAAHNQ